MRPRQEHQMRHDPFLLDPKGDHEWQRQAWALGEKVWPHTLFMGRDVFSKIKRQILFRNSANLIWVSVQVRSLLPA